MRKDKVDITYIGFSDNLIHNLLSHPLFNLVGVITVKGKIKSETYSMLQKNKIRLNEIMRADEVKDIAENIYTKVIIMYKFGFIIPEDITKIHIFFNIHSGDLRTNRGAHPLRWTILLHETTTKMTVYQVDGVDEGIIIDEREVYVNEDDDIICLEGKMEKHIDQLLEKVYEYLYAKKQKEYEVVYGGQYRQKVREKDYLINVNQDSYMDMLHKINAVKDFGGAVVFIDGKKYRVINAILRDKKQLNYKEKEKIRVVDICTKLNEMVRLLCKEYVFIE